MKKRVLLLLPLFLGACSDSGESPVIKIEKLYAKVESEDESSGSGEKDYANQRDEVKALLLLDGNGAELKTFRLQNDDEVDTKLIFEKTEVSTEGNLTDVEKGQLRFKDGVSKAKIMVIATIKQVDKNGDVKLEFYLSSKAECEGAQEEIGLKTKAEDDK